MTSARHWWKSQITSFTRPAVIKIGIKYLNLLMRLFPTKNSFVRSFTVDGFPAKLSESRNELSSGMNIPWICQDLFWLQKNPISYIWDLCKAPVELSIYRPFEIRWCHQQKGRIQRKWKQASLIEFWSQISFGRDIQWTPGYKGSECFWFCKSRIFLISNY